MINGGFAQHPVNLAGGQVPANQLGGQLPMNGGFLQLSSELIVQMGIVMAGVAGTELHGPFWKILDSIFYFVRNDRWASIPTIRGNFRSKASVQASHRAVGPPLPYVPATWPAYLASICAPEDEELRQGVQAHMAFAFDAFSFAVFMERMGSLESSYATVGQTRPIIARLHAKLASHEQQGLDWDADKHGAVDHQFNGLTISNVPESLASQKWQRRQKAYQTRTKYGATQASFRDAPRTEQEEGKKVKELVVAMLNLLHIVDKEYHKGGKLNHVLKEFKHMSLYNLESSAWDAMDELRTVALGMANAGVFDLDLNFKVYETFEARLEDFMTLFRSSKAAVTGTTETRKLVRFAGKPLGELSMKNMNRNGAEKKATYLAAVGEARTIIAAVAQGQQQGAAHKAAEPVQEQDSDLEHEEDSELEQEDYFKEGSEDAEDDESLPAAKRSRISNDDEVGQSL